MLFYSISVKWHEGGGGIMEFRFFLASLTLVRIGIVDDRVVVLTAVVVELDVVVVVEVVEFRLYQFTEVESKRIRNQMWRCCCYCWCC